MNQTLQTIHNRRSIRSFKNQAIGQDTVDRILEATLRAPTAGNMMLYSILQITDQDLKNKLVTTCDNQPFIAKAPLVLLFLADYQRWFDYFLVSGVQSYCQNHHLSMRQPGEGDLMLACCDALIAAQTSVIAAESLGIGSCYIGDIMENFEQHKLLFNLPQYTFPITMLCFGYPTKSAASRKLTSRFNQEDIVHKNRYAQPTGPQLHQIFADKTTDNYVGETINAGQHYYIKKFGADYSIEMTRSVQSAIRSWVAEVEDE